MGAPYSAPGEKKPRPFIKWAGGKGQLLKILQRRMPIPKKYLNYNEIFRGGGALLFALETAKIRGQLRFSDSNEELINVYQVVRNDVENLIHHLKRHHNTPEYFEAVRSWDRSPGYRRRSNLTRASRFIYLNKTAYNGLYRVNSRGEFNVPYGKYKNPNWINAENLRTCSKFLQRVDLQVAPFEDAMARLGRGDFVYLDPPYEPVSATANFTSYTDSGFTELEQVKLFLQCRKLHKRGTYFMLSNSAAPWIVELYRKEKAFRLERVRAKRLVNCKAEGRGAVKEIIVRNYT